MNLQEKRAEWERGQTSLLLISQVESGYPTVYSVVKGRSSFRLHRYFPTGIGSTNCGWEVSVDKDGTLEDCLSHLKDKLEPFNKKVEEADWEELDKNPLAGLLVKS